MQVNGLPFVVRGFLLLAIFALGFLWARDLFFVINGRLEQKEKKYVAAAPSPAPTKTKRQIISSDVPSAVRPTESKEPLLENRGEASTSLKQDPAKNLPADNLKAADRPLELGNGPAKNSGPNTQSLRADEGRLPVRDLRTGAEAKPMGSLRSLAESGITGSLRPDERLLPTGSLRPEEGSLPTGSLR
jgi:hypothetical protein